MPAFDRRRVTAALEAHAARFQTALRKGDEGALAELVLPAPPEWMLDRSVTRRAAVGVGSFAPERYGECVVTQVHVSFRAPWGTRDRVLVMDVAVSLDRGTTWRFIDGVPDAGRVIADPAYRAIRRHAARRGFLSPIYLTFGGGQYGTWAPVLRQTHALMLERMRRVLPRAPARAKALAFIQTLVRRYQGPLRASAARAVRSERLPVLGKIELLPAHLQRLRSFRVGWDDAEAGGPVLEPKARMPDLSARERAELLAAFEILLALGKLPPRTYVCDGKRVPITKAHARLLPALSAQWEGGDGPAVDPKRPYGYRSYFEYDVADLLGIEPAGRPDEDGPKLTRAQEKEIGALHRGMRGAVHALLLHGKLPTGTYRKTKNGWQRG